MSEDTGLHSLIIVRMMKGAFAKANDGVHLGSSC